jgi:hypothetical protein
MIAERKTTWNYLLTILEIPPATYSSTLECKSG